MNIITKFGLLLTLLIGCVASVMAESKEVTMQVGETQTLYLPSSVTSKNLRSVTFYSNGISYVQVESYTNYSVKVKAIKAFSSPIIVRCDYYYIINNGGYNYQASGFYDFLITVVGSGGSTNGPTQITFPTSAKVVDVGETIKLQPTIYPSNAECNLTWYINDRTVATVDQEGYLTGKSEGEADLKVTADNGVYAMLRVIVTKPAATSVSVSPTNLELTEGDMRYLNATVYPTTANQSVTWSSSNSAVATVSSSGRVTAVAVGTCTIKATTSNNRTASATVKVLPKKVNPTSIVLSKESVEIDEGDTTAFTATVLPSNATTNISWSSSNNSVATVKDGVISGLSAGECTITAITDNGLSATVYVIVKAKVVLPQEIELSSGSMQMVVGDKRVLSANVTPENATYSLTWNSSDPQIASVVNGEVTAIGEGECLITVSTQNGLTASCSVSVEVPIVLPQSIELSPSSIKLIPGETAFLSVSIYPEDAEYELSWISSDESVVTVDNGTVMAIAAGSALITVITQNGLSATCEVVVEDDTQVVTPSADWCATYRIHGTVDDKCISNYRFPSEFEMTIIKGEDEQYYIISFIGLNCMKSYPYTGLRLQIISDTEAAIDLGYEDNAGSWSNNGDYLYGLHSLCTQSEYSYLNKGKITLTRNADSQISITDFYVSYFGQLSEYEHVLAAHYSDCHGAVSELSDVENTNEPDAMIEIYTLTGQCVYRGMKDNLPELSHGIYIIRQGNRTYKISN